MTELLKQREELIDDLGRLTIVQHMLIRSGIGEVPVANTTPAEAFDEIYERKLDQLRIVTYAAIEQQ